MISELWKVKKVQLTSKKEKEQSAQRSYTVVENVSVFFASLQKKIARDPGRVLK